MGAAMMAVVACGGGSDADMDETPPAEAPAPAPAEPAGGGMAMQLPEGVTEAMVAQGKTIFENSGGCAACHGASGEGTALAPNLTDGDWLNTSGKNYDEIVAVVTNGVPEPVQFPSPMLPKAGTQITDDQVRAVAAYVYTLSN
jgi:mono/diheme cytochrome c family protein